MEVNNRGTIGDNPKGKHRQDDDLPPLLKQKLINLFSKEKNELLSLKRMTKKQFKHYNDLPLARIKRIMKSDEDVDMISAEAPILFAKACELFILDITVRALYEAECEKRVNIEKEDFFSVFHSTDVFDFLSEAVNQVHNENNCEVIDRAALMRQESHPQHGIDMRHDRQPIGNLPLELTKRRLAMQGNINEKKMRTD